MQQGTAFTCLSFSADGDWQLFAPRMLIRATDTCTTDAVWLANSVCRHQQLTTHQCNSRMPCGKTHTARAFVAQPQSEVLLQARERTTARARLSHFRPAGLSSGQSGQKSLGSTVMVLKNRTNRDHHWSLLPSLTRAGVHPSRTAAWAADGELGLPVFEEP
jgi:hypothetical protein